jgi:hypothetical protein
MTWPFVTMTEQEVFNTVAKHLLTQNKRSIGTGCGCAYRGAAGTKCAAGCLIPDARYNISMEQQLWRELVSANVVPDEHFQLVCRLQTIHDSHQPTQWRQELKKLASKHCLNFEFGDFKPTNEA